MERGTTVSDPKDPASGAEESTASYDPTIREVEEQTRKRSWWISGTVVLVIAVVFIFLGIVAFSS